MTIPKIFDLQRTLMDTLGVKVEKHVDVYSPEFLAAAIGIASEGMEVLDEVNVATRPWAEKSQEEVKQRIAEEAIDVLFYFAEIMILLGVTPEEILQLYEAKWKANMNRILHRKVLQKD